MQEYNIGYKPKAFTKVQFQKLFVNGVGNAATGGQILGDLAALQIPAAGNTATRALFTDNAAATYTGDGYRAVFKMVTASGKTFGVTFEHYDENTSLFAFGAAMVPVCHHQNGEVATAVVEANYEKTEYV